MVVSPWLNQRCSDERPTTNDQRPCLSPTNSGAPSPTCGYPSPTAVTTSVFTAGPETKERSTAICPSPTICAWRECSSGWGLPSFVLPAVSRCCAKVLWISSANLPNSALPTQTATEFETEAEIEDEKKARST